MKKWTVKKPVSNFANLKNTTAQEKNVVQSTKEETLDFISMKTSVSWLTSSKKMVKKINLDYIKSQEDIKKRCKFVIRHLSSISSYSISESLTKKYWARTFRFSVNPSLSVNFYGHKANSIVKRAIHSIQEQLIASKELVLEQEQELEQEQILGPGLELKQGLEQEPRVDYFQANLR